MKLPWIGSLSINNGGGGGGVNITIRDLDRDYHKGSADTAAPASISSLPDRYGLDSNTGGLLSILVVVVVIVMDDILLSIYFSGNIHGIFGRVPSLGGWWVRGAQKGGGGCDDDNN